MKVRRADEIAIEHHLRRLAVHGDDVPAGAKRRRTAVADHDDAIAEVEIAPRVQVEHLARGDGSHEEKRRDGLEGHGWRGFLLSRGGVAERRAERLHRLLRRNLGKLGHEGFPRRGGRLEPRLGRLELRETLLLREMLERRLEFQTLESRIRIRVDGVEHPPVLRLVLLHELRRVLRVLPPVPVLPGAGVIRHAKTLRRGFEVQTEIDAIEPSGVLRGRHPERTGEHAQPARREPQLLRQRVRRFVSPANHALQDASTDAGTRRNGIHETLETLPGDAVRDGGDGAEVTSTEIQRDVSRGEAAEIVGVGVRGGVLRQARARARVRGERQLRGQQRLRLAETFLQRSVRVAHETFALATVQRDGDLALHVDAARRQKFVRRALRLRAPLGRTVRGSNPASHNLLGLVAHRHDHRLSKVRPTHVHASAEKMREARRAVGPVAAGAKRDVAPLPDAKNQRLFLRGGAEDVHAGVLELAAHRQRVHRGKSGGTIDAELHSVEERTRAAETPTALGELAGRHTLKRAGLTREEPAEHLRKGRGHVLGAVGVVLEYDQRTRSVASNLRFGELLRRHGGDALLEERLVEEREQHDPLPVVPLALEVHLQFGREERRERGVRRVHEPTERLGKKRGALRRLHGEELLERAKRHAVLKLRREFPEPGAQIGRHGRVMEGIIPRPRRDAAIIVLKHPAESLEVRLAKLGERRRLTNLEPELLAIVHLLPTLDARAALLEHRALRRAHHRRVLGDAIVVGIGRRFGF